MFKLFHRKEKELFGENAFLVAGLGNPGKEYRSSRHNVGFMVVDRLAEDLGIKFNKAQLRSVLGMGKVDSGRVILVKPQTFMNLSGNSVAALMHYYKLSAEKLIVIHDDVDLPLGTIRLRASGSSGGQRGMDSIIREMGTSEFARLRVGIGRPPGRMPTASFVLEGFLPSEQDLLDIMLNRAMDAVKLFMADGIETSMNKYNGLKET